MRFGLIITFLISLGASLEGATLGTVTSPAGGAAYSDIVLDEPRTRLYLVNSTTNRIEIFNTRTRAFATPISVGAQPVSAAISRDGRYLYVTTYTGSTLDVIDLNSSQVVNRVSTPSSPEGVAVASDGRVLITSIAGTNQANSLLIFDAPGALAGNGNKLVSVPVIPPPSTPPVVPVPSGRLFTSYRSRLAATPDGRYIIGANGTSGTAKVVFVYESASGTVLRSRNVTNLSSTIAVSPDGSRFMAGATLFDLQTLQVIAQENAANAGFTFPNGTNFNLQQNEGGSAFSPDGSVLYAAFNVAPAGARANVTQLLLNDPDNLLINLGIEMPENLSGKMVIDAAGANIYALSDSGIMTLPVSTIANLPLAVPQSRSVLLINDQCNVFKAGTVATTIDNAGKGRFTISAVAGAAGGGAPGQPPTATANPTGTVVNTGTTPVINFRYNTAAATNPGTVGPTDFVLQSTEAINNPGIIHVFQNNRDSIASGNILPISTNAVTTEGLTDILLDTARGRIYIANSGMNRLEVYDTKQKRFLSPIKVGQMPHGMALDPDGSTLYVANAGGESITMVDLARGVQTGRVFFPALPFNAAVAIVNPVTIAASGRGPQFVMSDGSLWKIDGNLAIPRTLNSAIFGAGARGVAGGNPAQWSLAATPGGEFVLLTTGAGTAYLYDYTVDDFTLTKQVLTAPAGYVGPVTAGAGGRFYAIGGTILNSSLTPVQGGANGLSSLNRPVAAVTAVSATQVALFSVPIRVGNAAVTDAGMVETYDPVTGISAGTSAALEGPSTVVNGTARTLTFAHTMAVDSANATAYALTASGLSVIQLGAAANTSARPTVKSGGVVNLANFQSPVSSGELFSIFGANLGSAASSATPLATTLGGVCVTLNNVPIGLAMTSSGQINAQIPSTLAAGRYPLVIRSIDNQVASATTTVTVAKYAPAVFVDSSGQAAIMHPDGSYVTKSHAGKRDEQLTIYATGMGPTHGTNNDTDAVNVYFGNPLWVQGAIIVNSSTALPGVIGVTQIKVTIPGFHIKGDALPVLVKVGGVSSPTTGNGVPYIAVN